MKTKLLRKVRNKVRLYFRNGVYYITYKADIFINRRVIYTYNNKESAEMRYSLEIIAEAERIFGDRFKKRIK